MRCWSGDESSSLFFFFGTVWVWMDVIRRVVQSGITICSCLFVWLDMRGMRGSTRIQVVMTNTNTKAHRFLRINQTYSAFPERMESAIPPARRTMLRAATSSFECLNTVSMQFLPHANKTSPQSKIYGFNAHNLMMLLL